MNLVNNKCGSITNFNKSFIHYIHPSFKIILTILIFQIILSLNLENFRFVWDFTNKGIIKNFFCLLYYLFFIFIFLFLLIVVNYSFSMLLKKFLGFKFLFFFSLLLHCNIQNTNLYLEKSNYLYFPFWNLNEGTFFLIIFFLYLLPLFLFKKKKYKKFYFIFIFLFFFILPSFLNSSFSFFKEQTNSYLYFYKEDFFNIFFIFLRFFLFLMFNIVLKETTSFIEINYGLELILKPLKKIKFPVEILTLMLSLIFLSIPFLLEETQKILKAQISRGLNFYNKNIFKKTYYLLSLLIPIFILSFKKSFVLSNAMETRGYIIGKERTKFILYETKKTDYLILFLFLFLLYGVYFIK
ncbi:MAG: energy-coupling factor transporter transmembrane component T [Candidatus Phytoplasma stylosanthis]|nr:energy-coupling factor transporter transmembrane component T [Candidatus Phytoplasma stylosanthis]